MQFVRGAYGRNLMRQRVIHLMRPRAGLAAVVAMCWFWVVPVVDAATARAELKDARGTKVGGATLVDTPEGVKISARFTELPPGEHGFHVCGQAVISDSRLLQPSTTADSGLWG